MLFTVWYDKFWNSYLHFFLQDCRKEIGMQILKLQYENECILKTCMLNPLESSDLFLSVSNIHVWTKNTVLVWGRMVGQQLFHRLASWQASCGLRISCALLSHSSCAGCDISSCGSCSDISKIYLDAAALASLGYKAGSLLDLEQCCGAVAGEKAPGCCCLT